MAISFSDRGGRRQAGQGGMRCCGRRGLWSLAAGVTLVARPGRAEGGRSAEAARAREALARAASFLCADCRDDIERDGVNRPMRRALLAQGWVRQAREALEAVPAGARPRRLVEEAMAALEELDEARALRAIRAARRALRDR